MDETICINLTNVLFATFNIITFKVLFPGEGVGGGRGTWVNFCWVCATGLALKFPFLSNACNACHVC